MARAAETAAHIASDSRTRAAAARRRRRPWTAATAQTTIGVLTLAERIALVERADRAARAYDPRIEKVIATLGDETKQRAHRQLRWACWPRTCSRSSRSACRVIASENGVRREGSAGGGGRMGPEFFDDEAARALRARGGAHGRHPARRRGGARGADARGAGARAGRASCCTRRSATGWRATSTARARRRSPAASASAWRRRASPWSTTAPSPTAAAA